MAPLVNGRADCGQSSGTDMRVRTEASALHPPLTTGDAD